MSNIINYNKVILDDYKKIDSLNIKDMNKIIKHINLDNKTVYIINKSWFILWFMINYILLGGLIMTTILIIVSILLIAIVLLQSGKAEGASSIITGGNSDLFKNRKERGGELVVTYTTAILGVIFFVLCIIL